MGITRALVVTDAGVRGRRQPVLDALGPCAGGGVRGRASNPPKSAVRGGVAQYAQHGCDGLIAVGGGSPIDCAKGAAIAATHPPLTTYATIEGGSAHHRRRRVADRRATTAGTGSEVARGAIVIVDDGRKLGFHPGT